MSNTDVTMIPICCIRLSGTMVYLIMIDVAFTTTQLMNQKSLDFYFCHCYNPFISHKSIVDFLILGLSNSEKISKIIVTN